MISPSPRLTVPCLLRAAKRSPPLAARRLSQLGVVNALLPRPVRVRQHVSRPWNAWDASAARTPGGARRGSGVAVAARMAPWAIGTDTGGSVRMPASFCGLTGLKVTVGRISTYGIIPLSGTLDTPGPMARSVEDAALLYNVLQGPDPLDVTTRGIAAHGPLPFIGRAVRGLRLARMPKAEREGVAPDMLAAYDQSLDSLASLGADVVDIALPFRFADL